MTRLRYFRWVWYAWATRSLMHRKAWAACNARRQSYTWAMFYAQARIRRAVWPVPSSGGMTVWGALDEWDV